MATPQSKEKLLAFPKPKIVRELGKALGKYVCGNDYVFIMMINDSPREWDPLKSLDDLKMIWKEIIKRGLLVEYYRIIGGIGLEDPHFPPDESYEHTHWIFPEEPFFFYGMCFPIFMDPDLLGRAAWLVLCNNGDVGNIEEEEL